MIRFAIAFILLVVVGCATEQEALEQTSRQPASNILDYRGEVSGKNDRSTLSFSDQGAWFSFGLPSVGDTIVGFKGPFLMQMENGVWMSSQYIDFQPNLRGRQLSCVASTSHASHLSAVFANDTFEVSLSVYFSSGRTAITEFNVKNVSRKLQSLVPHCRLAFWEDFPVKVKESKEGLRFILGESRSGLMLQLLNGKCELREENDAYTLSIPEEKLLPDSSVCYTFATTSVVYGDSYLQELEALENGSYDLLKERLEEKDQELNMVLQRRLPIAESYHNVVEKCLWTLQNNWRVASGELRHQGLFPSYHYEWFHGYWAWDSWKHAVALALFNPELAKEQVRAMYSYMDDSGFIPDCVYRDTTIEPHNYRNTKPPLSGWAIWEIYKADQDTLFLSEMYERLCLQHSWWYLHRDYDQDGMCEYGSTDGTLIAAKWESGMDNAVRFDESALNRMNEKSYTLNQESVDLNAYLLAEKRYIVQISEVLGKQKELVQWREDFETRLPQFQNQFYDEKSGWFYDTSLDGSEFIEVKGCEGWTPLWAKLATKSQAKSVMNTMMSDAFNQKVPFQTLDANHSLFKPDRGYWRGPVWLDQTYFGIQGLKNYSFDAEANQAIQKVLNNCEGLNEPGPAIRENYHPITGEGMEAYNFSWSAAHILLMLTDL